MPHPQDPPLKRRRVDSGGMAEPDGFTKAKPTTKPRSRVSVPVFQSAFGEGSSRKAETDGAQRGAAVKPVSRTSARPVQLSKAKVEERDTPMKTIMVPKPTITPKLPSSDNKASDVLKPVGLLSSKNFQHVKPSQLQVPPSHSQKPVSKTKVLVPPVMLNHSASSSIVTPNNPAKPLKALAPPSFPISDPPPLAEHKPIPQLLPLHQATAPAKPFKTIGSTRVARATDISTDGAAELASILLQQHHVEEESDGHQEPESRRGLEVSPQKGRSYGATKFIRGGLAAQASSILSHLNTSLALWTKEISLHSASLGSTSASGSNPASSRLPKPDMRLQIVKVLHVPPPANSFSIASIPGIALCRTEIASKITPFPLETPSQHADHVEFRYILTLLSFAARPSPGTAIRNPAHFHENREIWVWKPWRNVSMNGWAGHVRNSSVTEVQDTTDHQLFFELPEQTGGGTTTEKVPLENEAYLCDRFMIIRR
ncbi:hypothetical protein PM082_008691 [Marasmius tenuissimus]|nr:hypothetical protein PM082_008691 [Marasmius tenuissimus]